MRRIGKRLIVTCVSLSMILQSFAPATNALAATINAAAEAGAYSTTDGAASETGGDTSGNTGSAKDDAASASPDTGENTGEDTSGADQVTDGAEGSQEEAADNEEGAVAEDAAADEGEAEAQAQGTYKYNTLDELTANGVLLGTVENDGTEITALTTSDLAKDLKTLSNAAPALYKNAKIVASQTSDAIDLSADFNGLGGSSVDDAFAGTIAASSGAAIRIKVNRPLFNGLRVTTEQKYLIEWAAEGSQDAVLANRAYGSEDAIADVTVYGVSGSTEKLTAPIIATLQGNLTAKVMLDKSTMTSVNITSSISSIGVVAGTVESGTLTLAGLGMLGVTAVTVDASGNTNPDQKNGNAGLLVGRVADGAGLTINTEIAAPSGVIKSATGKDNASAGAVVGKLGTGDGGTATPVVVNKSIDVSALAVTGAIAGGFIGRAGNVSLTFGDGASITPAKKMEATVASGGLLGRATLAADLEITPSKLIMPNDGIEVSGINAGGLFGVLISSDGCLVARGASIDSPFKLKVTAKNVASNSNSKGVGGVIGMLDQAKTVAKVDLINIGVDLTSDGSSYVGGMVGNCWGSSVLQSSSSVVNSDGVSVTAAVSNCTAFGGVTGITRANPNYSVTVLVRNLTVATAEGKPVASGGGVVGSANCKTLIRLSGKTDLSEVCYDESGSLGQITSLNTSKGFGGPLVFATGSGNDADWMFIRGKNKTGKHPEIDDIGGYGEVIRLGGKLSKDFLTVDESTGTLTIKGSNESAATISSVEDFARLAITWETNGVFKGVSDSNWASMEIALTDDIDLTGTGIYGLTREGAYDDKATTNSINGNNHKLVLSIGEAYGTWDGKTKVGDNDPGNGRIYRHKLLGLFAVGNGSASNLTIDGTINVDTKIDGMAVGAFAATCTSGTDLSFNNVVCKTTMNIKANNKIIVGGFIGKTTTNKQLEFTGGSSFAGDINMSNVAQTKTYIGGAFGYIDGDSTPTITVKDMKLSGSIAAQTNNAKLCAGGLIGFIDQVKNDANKTKTVTISGLDLGGLKLDFSAAGDASAAGGYLGSTWAQTNVTIEGSGSAYAIRASKAASLKTGSAKHVGGLVYHAGGVWTVGSKAIDFNNVGIESKASELGLLVCRGGRGKEAGISSEEMGSLYLNVTKHWDDAVSFNGINLTGTEPAAMDEWVADTRGYSDNNAGDIFASGKNGVVSLTTESGTVVMDDNGTRNTYENQTAWGRNRQENGNTRYYYNLNKVIGDVDKQPNDTVDTPGELLLWSVRHYADGALQAEFNKGDATCETITGTLNMKGYSYYPVDIANCSVNINNATITFWNKQIETLESGNTKNKLTIESSQHQAMHCGLIRNYSSSGNQGGQTLSVKKLTLSGTVGPVGANGGSGALICGTARGEAAATTTASLEGITLDGLAVTNFAANKDKGMPLLVNAGGSHLSLSVNDLSCTGYTAVGENNTVASSLMGNMGGKDETGINLSFSNTSIPSHKDERIFASALLMMSFGYKTDGSGSASYNFTADDKKVTYGQEIDGTEEYGNNDGDTQYWYFDAEHVDDNLVKDGKRTTASKDKSKPSFGAQGNLLSSAPYLKYVANGHDDSNPWRHEVAVNHSAAKLIKGCGTYTDPYVISSAKNLRDAANIIQGASASGSEVNITINQDAACSGENGHGKFVSNGNTWVYGDRSYATETVSRYLRSAYYVIDKDITVNVKDFSGLGQTPERAFRGVIVGKNSATLIIKNDNDSKKQFMGLIPYSYGSVVKDLKIRYEGAALSIAYAAPKDQDPQAFFGGVVGCVLGGDNIVDDVTVSAGEGFSVGGADKNTPIGGYVGVAAGGGVLFRNMNKDSWHTAGESLYDNAFLGRMLNGYAFSEGCAVDNGERNYKINEISKPSGDKPISSDSLVNANEKKGIPYSVSVSSAEGLLALSGIINSGAAAGYGTRAYDGVSGDQEGLKLGNALYGKVRNAQYDQVGNTSLDVNNSEWLAAKQDDQSAPSAGNTAYLVTTFADANTGNICADKTAYVEFNLNGDSFNMTKYSTGYLGLSARYVSNAGIDRSGKSQPARVMPSVAAVKGSADASTGTMLKVKLDVKEYKTDDYHLLGVGGLFGVANFRTPGKTASGAYTFNPDTYSIINNLTIGDSNISLSYVDADNSSVTPALDNVTLDANADANKKYKSIVGVGGVAGVLAPSDSKYMGGQVTNFTTSGLVITSPSSAGSLFGHAGYAILSAGDKYLATAGSELSGMTMRLVNCGFSNLDITADRDAGGFFGYLVTKKNGNSGVWNKTRTTYGANSNIVSNGKELNGSKATGAGGFVGHAKNSFNVNAWNDSSSTVIEGLTLDNDRNAYDAAGTGGLIGIYEAVNECACTISNVEVISTEGAKTVIKGCKFVGGIIGLVGKGSLHVITIDNVSIDAVEMPKSSEAKPAGQLALGYKGAVVGGMNGSSGKMTLSNSAVSNIAFDDALSGFVIGCVGSGVSTVYVLNDRFENDTLNAENSGALVGYDAGKVYGQNILIRNLTYAKVGSQGLLLGSLYIKAGNAEPGVCVAGLDLQLSAKQTNDSVPARLAATKNDGVDGRSFVAFADYNDNAKTNGSSVTSEAFDAEAADPYATTSPSNELTVAASDGSSKALFGDSMNPSTAKTIQVEKDSKDAGTFHYTSAPSVDFSNTVSTMAKNNDGATLANDFGVLQVSSGNEQVITDYLDTVTNGGYSRAKNLGCVTASAKTYAYDDGSKQFVAPAEGTAAASMKQALEVTGSGSSLGYSVTSGYDNGLMRITLLTVKIGYAKDKGYYVLHVPIVVRRMLEVDFTATLTGGTVFNKTAYANLGKDAHVLESYGSSMTGLLTYTYNSAVGERMEYGWDGYLADGGSTGATNKTLVFASSGEDNGNYPMGTQLTLLDCAHNNKEYHYEVETEGGISSLSLSDFKDTAGKSYEQRWLSDLMGVAAKTDSSGKWVMTDKASAAASGKLDDGTVAYFRPTTKDDTGEHYNLTVEKGKDGKEQSPSENFYLVVRFPKDDQATAAAVVGKLKSSLSFAGGTSIATRVNQVLRPKFDNKVVKDDVANTASTYSILTGYKQELMDNDATAGPSVPTLTNSGHEVQLDVTDTISFNSSQVYNDDDLLFYELSTTLGQWATGDKSVGSGGFPSGMSGTVTFYAQVGDTYYEYKNGGWQASGTDAVASGLGYGWTSDGGEMKLLLGSSNNEGDVVSLSGLRKAAKDAGQTSFTIRAQMTIEMTDEAFTKAIAASSEAGKDNWTQMVFRGQLATKADQLAYTSLAAKVIGNHKYYREGSAYSTISLAASLPSQLGINIDDLRQATADGTIGTVATYDLSNASNVDELLSKARSVTFTATLMRKSDTDGNYVSADITKVMSGGDKPKTNSTVLGAAAKGTKSYSWTDTKNADGKFSTLNGQKFELPIDFVVDTTKDAQVYANYRIVVTAEISGEVINRPGNTSDFVTFTLTRVNTKGIQ